MPQRTTAPAFAHTQTLALIVSRRLAMLFWAPFIDDRIALLPKPPSREHDQKVPFLAGVEWMTCFHQSTYLSFYKYNMIV
jgi:hypothetical protein